MGFSFRLLRVFVAVAHQESFTRAAAQLGLTQPAVSKSMRDLERRAGVALVERGATGVRLTEPGRVLLAHARTILAEARAADESLNAIRGIGGGVLRIGASPTIATYLLPALLQRFHTRHPAVEVSLHTAPSRAVARALLEREIDIGLIEASVPDDPRLQVASWREDELVVIAAPSHPLAPQSPIETGALAQELIVLREPGSGTRQFVLTALASRAIVPQRTLDADSVEAIKRIVAAGLGISIVSRAAIEDMLALRRLVVLELTDLEITRPLRRLTVRNHRSAAVRAFVSMLTRG
ncbi:MAG TPA: LysR family transcriptional regulator [Gemmatimonadaceae bacterium]|nr:LysR family transcriptional regulator [Gemmatimonadaceae bacterium]